MSAIREHFRNTFEPALLEELDKLPLQEAPAGTELRHEAQSRVRYTPLVLSGSIKVTRIDWKGKEILMYFIGPRESCFLTITASLNNNFDNITALRAVCEEDTTMIPLADHTIRDWHEKYSTWRHFISNLYNARFTEFFSLIDAIAFKSVDTRLLDSLQSLKDANNEISITHQELAHRIGSVREVVSRLLKNLEKDNKVLLARGKITVMV